MYQHDAALCAAAHLRRSPTADGCASNSAGHAVATMHSRAAVRVAEVGDFRPSTLPAPRRVRCAGRNQSRNHGLQLENDDARGGRKQVEEYPNRLNTNRADSLQFHTKKQKAPVNSERLLLR